LKNYSELRRWVSPLKERFRVIEVVWTVRENNEPGVLGYHVPPFMKNIEILNF
jgi:hypothetical protein